MIIPIKKSTFAIYFNGFCFALWLVIGGYIILTHLPDGFDWPLVLWSAAWAGVSIFGIRDLLRALFGKQLIFVTSGVLTLRDQILIPLRMRMYPVSGIRRLRLLDEPRRDGNATFLPIPRLSFDYRDETVKFASDLDDAEAQLLLKILIRHMPTLHRDAEPADDR